MPTRRPDDVTAKPQRNGDETLWFDDYYPPSKKGAVISHRPGTDFLSITLMDDSEGRQLFMFVNRSVAQKLLPYLKAFAEGGDFGITNERVL